ncbi:TraB/GumN family protein [Pseudohongiella spirulinae]|uniref:Conjugative transfer protein GumN n=1 Tax=Pseudohongiella spirulinae TaxID=1249552 RepID=A0A0S2KA12_9GAMM|nr:TraB/GumN family protein [Pseudohongiella spirulinae]ALO44834.1 conjugative transfer protein GumN [Pseudohongiella spirulinae]
MLIVKRMWGRVWLIAGLVLFVATGAVADTSVWKVSKDDDYIYMGGTIHLLRASDYPLPSAFEQAYADSDRLFFETDLGAMMDPSLQQRMMTQMTYQDGRTLRSVLNEEAYQTLTEFIDGAGLPVPMAMMQTFKPGLLISTITVLEVQKLGFTPQGVDAFYHTRAMGDGKPRGELESLDEQISLLAGMGEGHESEYILYSLQDFENLEQSIEEMVRAWRSADLQALEDQFVSTMLEFSDELYESMLVKRNNAWLPRIEAMFDQDGTEYVLAGVAHMVGDDGLLAMLQQRGYSVEQVMSED